MRFRPLAALACCALAVTSGSVLASPAPNDDMVGAAAATERAERGPVTTVSTLPVSTQRLLAEVFALINEARARAGLAPVALDVRLVQGAQFHSEGMAARDVLSHDGPHGETAAELIAATGYPAVAWMINVAFAYWSSASVMRGWMASDVHRDNILSPRITHVGIGLAVAADGAPYWTLIGAAQS